MSDKHWAIFQVVKNNLTWLGNLLLMWTHCTSTCCTTQTFTCKIQSVDSECFVICIAICRSMDISIVCSNELCDMNHCFFLKSTVDLNIPLHVPIVVSPERMFVETHSDPNSVCPCVRPSVRPSVRSSVRPSVKVLVNLFQIAPVRTGSLQL